MARCPICGAEIDHVEEEVPVWERWAVYRGGRREFMRSEVDAARSPVYYCPECGEELSPEEAREVVGEEGL